MTGPIQIDVCICTFRRDSVTEAIRSVAAQILPMGVTPRLVVADNDEAPSAKGRVLHSGAEMPNIYVHAPARNISIARNVCLDAAQGEFVPFLDDHETAPPDWISTLRSCQQDSGADAVVHEKCASAASLTCHLTFIQSGPKSVGLIRRLAQVEQPTAARSFRWRSRQVHLFVSANSLNNLAFRGLFQEDLSINNMHQA